MTTRKPKAPVTEPLVASIEKVLRKHRENRHYMEGGNGVSCFVWINGRVFSSENSLNLKGNVVGDLMEVKNVRTVKINID